MLKMTSNEFPAWTISNPNVFDVATPPPIVIQESRAGRIVSYIHSDSITPNKGGSLVCVTCDTDFAAKTLEFIKFSERVAKMAYAAGGTTDSWADIIALFVDLEEERIALGKVLKEDIIITEVVVMKL